MGIRIEDIEGMDFSDLAEGRERMAPVSPGEILRHEFMEPLGLSANALARKLHVPPNRVTAILNATRSVTADSALRLGRFFGTSAEFWLNLQTRYDLETARRRIGDRLERITPRGQEAA